MDDSRSDSGQLVSRVGVRWTVGVQFWMLGIEWN